MPIKTTSIGTYQIHGELYPILSEAWKKGQYYVDTAPNYRNGKAHQELSDSLKRAHEERIFLNPNQIHISTKVGFIPYNEKDSLISKGIIKDADTYHSHNISETYIRYQLKNTFDIFKDKNLEILFLHNPEVQFNLRNKEEVLSYIWKAFEYMEFLADNNKIAGYGVATWTGFEGNDPSKKFSVKELLSLAENIAGTTHHFKAIQLPISMIKIEALKIALEDQVGPLQEATQLNIDVHVSSPLHGGQLPKILSNELIKLIDDRLSPAQAALLFSRSHPSVKRILTSPSTIGQLNEILAVEPLDDLKTEKILELINLLK